ncbi:hypothetical protein [Streptomyces spongiae]|uniref:hypothetical protein n=1 Tax=Streptomyces spongiae TaxID=565072 RepID=UPI001D136B01|nr:hypothetical protein [Streptomyces spongiae]
MTTERNTTAALLDEGAVLLPGSTDGDDADVLTARTYTHPALDGRPVVRLVPGTLGEAEDLVMEFLGLTRPADVPEVGQVRRETLGFPAWPLVHDPANGHHALALVKDIERLARLAGPRPGAAKDGFESLGERLSAAVPHFLPTYYEEVARIWIRHDNTTYAAMFFGRARAAERAHALDVDEERQRAVFLEFAFAGALPVKALKEYGRDLIERLGPAEAWSRFSRLIVERCEAGLPPYASLPKDARALIKAAGLDRAEAERSLVADLLASPTVVRAPASFWTDYRATLVDLGRHDPAVRARLLEFLPLGIGDDIASGESWLKLLADSGAEALLTGAPASGAVVSEVGSLADSPADALADSAVGVSADSAAGVSGGSPTDTPTGHPHTGGITPADWLSRWERHRHRGKAPDDSSATLALVQRMVPRLLVDARPVDLFIPQRGYGPDVTVDIDLLDLCLTAGVPLTVPCGDTTIGLPLDRWLQEPRTGARDLAAVATDRRFRPMLYDALGSADLSRLTPSALDTLADHPVLRPLLHDVLADRAAEFVGAVGLPGSRAALGTLQRFRKVPARVDPDAFEAVAAHDLAQLLLRTLRTGIFDELGWPALEEALDRIGEVDTSTTWFVVQEAWPALILAREGKAVVVGPDRILLEHDLRIPVEGRLVRPGFRWADGELLVNWESYRANTYWSGRPDHAFALQGEQLFGTRLKFEPKIPSLPLPGGGRATGGGTLRAGDHAVPTSRPLLGDGTGYWALVRNDDETYWVEHDPLTGADGGPSLPAFLRSGTGDADDAGDAGDADGAEDTGDGTTLLPERCQLLPLLPGLENTPFGTDGRILGRRVHRSGTGAQAVITVGTPDGRTTSLPSGTGSVPLGTLRLPGGSGPVAGQKHPRSVTLYSADSGPIGDLGTVTIEEPGGEFAAGTRFVPPVPFWHVLVPRDERGSLALRALTTESAATLLSATTEALAAQRAEAATAEARSLRYTGPTPDEVAQSAVARCLPDVTHPSLLAGVASIVRAFSAHAADTAEFVAARQPQEAPPRHLKGMYPDYEPEHGSDPAICHALVNIAAKRTYGWHAFEGKWTVLRHIRAVNHVLSAKPADGIALPEPEVLAHLIDGWTSDARTVPGVVPPWLGALDTTAPLAWRATAPGIGPERREALLLLLDAITEGPLADPGSPLREVVLREPRAGSGERAGQVLRHGDRTVVIQREVGRDDREMQWLALDHDPSGEFGAVAHFTVHKERRRTPGLPASRITALTGLVRERGPVPWRPQAVGELVAATGGGLGPAQAALLLGGLPSETAITPQLTAIGLTFRQAELGEELLNSLGDDHTLALLTALLPEDAERLWRDGPDLAAAARCWSDTFGDLVRVPEELADRVRGEIVDGLLNPSRTAWLHRTTTLRVADGELVADDPSAIPHRHVCNRAAKDLAVLAYNLPHGHPVRPVLAAGLEALRHRLSDPDLLLDLIGVRVRGLIREAHGMPETGGAGPDGLTRVGEAIVLYTARFGEEKAVLRPAGLTGADDPVLELLESGGDQDRFATKGIRAVLGDDLAGAVAVGHGPGTPHGWAQDPTLSAPDLVTEVASVLGLGADAAAHYLQLLALPDPTDRNCVRWTGWKPARMKQARAELAATDLVVEAKRPRAGRGLFLPGAWLGFTSGSLPVEAWKRQLYPITDYEPAVPMTSVADLFARAWTRVRDGDAPAFEELTTRAPGKGHSR